MRLEAAPSPTVLSVHISADGTTTVETSLPDEEREDLLRTLSAALAEPTIEETR